MYFQIQIFTKRVYTGSFRESALLPFSTNTEKVTMDRTFIQNENDIEKGQEGINIFVGDLCNSLIPHGQTG